MRVVPCPTVAPMTNLVEFPAGGALKMRVAEEVRVLMTRQRVKQADLAAVLSTKGRRL